LDSSQNVNPNFTFFCQAVKMNPLVPSKEAAPNLIYTVAIDAPGSEGSRQLAKFLASSLLRTFFTGDIVVFRNSETPLFLVERAGLHEVQIDAGELSGDAMAHDAWCWKYRAAELLEVQGYDKVMFLDADCLALRNVDELLAGDWDIRYQPEHGTCATDGCYNASLTGEEMGQVAAQPGVNSGSLAIRAEIFHEVMRAWRQIDEAPRQRQSGF
jgi:hypothetical protein